MTGREGLRWRKANRSNNTGANCVEVAGDLSGWAVRDSKSSSGPTLSFNEESVAAFLTYVRHM
jgi:Domain of unknown function (DUF397)